MTDSKDSERFGFHGLRLSPKLWVVIAACIGLTASVASFIIIYRLRKDDTKEIFYRTAEGAVSSLEQGLDTYMLVLQSLAAFHDASEEVTRQSFGRFVNRFLLQYPGIQALEWIPRVPISMRASYEESARRNGFPNFRITERNAPGELVSSSERPEYFPVYYVEPDAGNEIALGFDLASNSVRLSALSASRDTGRFVATVPITLVQETQSQKGVLVFIPVYRTGAVSDSIETRRANLIGFFPAVFRVRDFVHHSVVYHKAEGVDFYLFDDAASTGEELLYFHRSGNGAALPRSIDAWAGLTAGLHYEKTFKMAETLLANPVCSGFRKVQSDARMGRLDQPHRRTPVYWACDRLHLDNPSLYGEGETVYRGTD